jgi:hypothetical protein
MMQACNWLISYLVCVRLALLNGLLTVSLLLLLLLQTSCLVRA